MAAAVAPAEGMWVDGVPPWQRALELAATMRLRGLAPTERTYGAAIDLCARVGDTDGAIELLLALPSLLLAPLLALIPP